MPKCDYDGEILSLSINNNNELLCAGGDTGIIFIYNFKFKSLLKKINSGYGYIYSITFNNKGHIAATKESQNCI